MKSYFKSELARAAGVSSNTFRRWLNQHRHTLQMMGIGPTRHLLPPIAVQWVCQEYGIDPREL